MKSEKALTQAYYQLAGLPNLLKDRVKSIMGWRADTPFYDRVKGRVKCTPAEQQAFRNAFAELGIPAFELFPAGEEQPVTAE